MRNVLNHNNIEIIIFFYKYNENIFFNSLYITETN